jgi:hypothetical protein
LASDHLRRVIKVAVLFAVPNLLHILHKRWRRAFELEGGALAQVTFIAITLATLTCVAINIGTVYVLINGPVRLFLTVFMKKLLIKNASNSYYSFIFPL